jgi:uncharacterized protein YndB with AHSA1/START domain
MSARTVTHHSFTIERELPHAPERVYGAWADPRAKASWFAAPKSVCTEVIREQDFKVGGKERLRGEWNNGRTSDFHCVYQDIVPNRRIVYSYNMYVNDEKLSVSLATIEFEPMQVNGEVGGKASTRLILTEQGAYFDGNQDGGPSREQGTRGLVEMLAGYLDG